MLLLFVDRHYRHYHRHYHLPPLLSISVHVHGSNVASILKNIILATRRKRDEMRERERDGMNWGAVNAESIKTEPGLTTFLTFRNS